MADEQVTEEVVPEELEETTGEEMEDVSLVELGLEEETPVETEPEVEPEATGAEVIAALRAEIESLKARQKPEEVAPVQETPPPLSRESRVSAMFYEEMAAQGYDGQTAYQMNQDRDPIAIQALRVSDREIGRQIEHENLTARFADMQNVLAETVNVPRVIASVKAFLGDGTSDEMANAVTERLIVHFPNIKQNPGVLNTIPKADLDNLLEDMQYAVIGRRTAAAARKKGAPATTATTLSTGNEMETTASIKSGDIPFPIAENVREMAKIGISREEQLKYVKDSLALINKNGGS